MTSQELFALPMDPNDAEAPTIGAYLSALLQQVWVKDEGFSGKRPFGNSGWKWDVYAALVRGGAVAGAFVREEEGTVLDTVDREAADALLLAAIAEGCGQSA